MNEEILAKLKTFVATDVLKQPGRSINPNDPLLSTGIIDSFHLVDLALFVEDNFGVHIDDSELNASVFDTLNQLVAIIESR